MRILETSAIVRYLNDVLPGKSLVPATPKDRARMDMVVGLLDSYGYGALIGGSLLTICSRTSLVARRRDAQSGHRERAQGDPPRDEDEGRGPRSSPAI
jgi:glutathione S-transferase